MPLNKSIEMVKKKTYGMKEESKKVRAHVGEWPGGLIWLVPSRLALFDLYTVLSG